MNSWQMQEAKQKFSELVKKAWEEGPQEITYRGKENAWLISAEDYKKLKRNRENILEFFQNSPHRDINIPFERSLDTPRDID
ncbi:MAG: type II toxin-antitoxin system Phd/YefM family antitoxin [Parachlamydia sp.]|jgi:prevent-host-death family protein|nr:type II toxin-antitoxin system Phd/YefM family antitoxin [Parachlamydia sp.]